jgi:hypothetical protein
LFSFGNILKITKVVQIFGLLFPHGESCVLILTKNGLGYMLADFLQTILVTLFLSLIRGNKIGGSSFFGGGNSGKKLEIFLFVV